ncbi:MAG: hypothetical protein ABIQ95_05940, partial [Bdellovibrionia bacterium]
MREKILLVSMLIFGMGCSGGETQGDVESELRPLIAPKGNLENRSKVLESPTTSSETREILQVNVLTLTSNETRPRLPDHGNIAIPASDLENETPENVTRTESDTIFHTKFFLPRQETEESRAQTQKKHQFFAWPEKFGTSMIQLASYSHRVLRNGEWLGNFRPKRVWHDNIHFRWFIPFFDIFQDSDFYSEDGAHLDDLQLVTVDLLLDSGLRFTYQIKFQVVGPVPELSLKPLDSPPLPDPLLLGDQVSTLGWVIKREELLNPSQHSL